MTSSRAKLTVTCIAGGILCVGCTAPKPVDPAAYDSYDTVSIGTRQFEWDTDNGPGIIRVLIEEANLGSQGVEIAEIWFPPGWHGSPRSGPDSLVDKIPVIGICQNAVYVVRPSRTLRPDFVETVLAPICG